MSVFMDLNLSFTADTDVLRSLIETAAHRESVFCFHWRSTNLNLTELTVLAELMASGSFSHRVCASARVRVSYFGTTWVIFTPDQVDSVRFRLLNIA